MSLLRANYTAEVRRPTRWLAIGLLMAASLVSCTCLAACVGVALLRIKGVPVGALWGSLAVFAVLSGASVWMLIRMLRGVRAQNGRTVMPLWFIQGFGVLVICGVVFAAVKERNLLLLVEGLGVALAMLGIRRMLKAPVTQSDDAT